MEELADIEQEIANLEEDGELDSEFQQVGFGSLLNLQTELHDTTPLYEQQQ